MGGSYRQCGECGKRALSIATRCPGCGREFPPAPSPEVGAVAKVGRSISPAAAGLVAVAAVLLAMELGSSDRLSDAPASATNVESPGLDPESEVAYAMGASARLDTASVEATPDAPAAEILVAKTWTNVRKGRSRRAGLEAILSPGDSVLADSLDRGWYRVSFVGEVLGYAHRSTLEAPSIHSQ